MPHMPFSPLDALLDALPDVRKAGRVTKTDTVSTVQQRMADVYLPIVGRIQKQAQEELRREFRKILNRYGRHLYHNCLYKQVGGNKWEHRGNITECACGLAQYLKE